MRRVLLTRAKAQAIESAQRLRALGWEPVMLPLYEIDLLPAPTIPILYKGLVITSQNATHAANNISRAQRPSIACYVVGKRSAELLRHQGFNIAMVCDTASELLTEMRKEMLKNHLPTPLLYLRGAEVKLNIKSVLMQSGITVEENIVYKTIARSDLPAVTLAQVEAALFYSNRNSTLFSELASNDSYTLEILRNITAIAISNEAAQALYKLPFKQVVVCKKPTENAMLQCLSL